MDIVQKQILAISAMSFLVFMFLSTRKAEKSIEFIRWYKILAEDEKKKYDPFIALKRTKRIMLLASFVGVLGFMASIYIEPWLKNVTFVLLVVVFLIQPIYAGPKRSLRKKNKNHKNT